MEMKIWICIYILTMKGCMSERDLQISPFPHAYTIEYSSLMLTCFYGGPSNDFNLLTWILNNTRTFSIITNCSAFGLPPDPAIYQYACLSSVEFTWTILNVTREQHGIQWMCHTNSWDSIRSSPTKIFVIVPVSHAIISEPAEEVITVEENQTLRLTCTTSVERPRSLMKWYLGKDELLLFDGIKEPSNNDSLASTVWTISYRFNRSYDGMYLHCSASNNIYTQTVFSDKKLLHILFIYGPETVLLNISSHTSIDEDDSLVISCLSTCYPQCVYTWKRGGYLLPSSNGILVLGFLKRYDAGVYTCSVRNSADSSLEANTTVRIDIRYKATIIEFGHVLNTSESPVILKEHEDLVILCKVDSFPGSRIIIQKDYQLKGSIKDSHQLLITVKNIECQDAGLYMCTAVNEQMTNTSTIASTRELNVFVKCPPRAADGVLIHSFAERMQPVVLSVLVRAYPAPRAYVWYKMTSNDWSIMSASNGVLISSIDFQSNLTIEAFTTTDVGMYGVSVYNGLFEKPIVKVFHVYLKGVPETPFNFNCKLLALYSKSVLVSWQEGTNGGFEQTFVVQYKDENVGKWIEMYLARNKTGDGYHAVEINALSPGSTYKIRMFARSEKGSSNATDDWIVALPAQAVGESAQSVGSIVGGSIGGFGVGLLIGVIVFKALLLFRRVSEKKTEVAKKGQDPAKNVDMYYNVFEEELQDSRNDKDKGPRNLQKQAADERSNTSTAEYEELQCKNTDQPYEQMKAVST